MEKYRKTYKNVRNPISSRLRNPSSRSNVVLTAKLYKMISR